MQSYLVSSGACNAAQGRVRISLVFNAVRHTPPGTRADVFWDCGPNQACFAVRDFGPGIARLISHRLPLDDIAGILSGGAPKGSLKVQFSAE